METSEDSGPQHPDPREPFSRVTMTPSFIGLTGAQGALPHHYTERLIEREHLFRDRAARAFLDIFSNRATTLFYAAWEKYRLPIREEVHGRERFLDLLLALAGGGYRTDRAEKLQPDHELLDESLAHFSGLLRTAPRSADSVANVLGSYFQTEVRISQFVGRWFLLPPEARGELGLGAVTLGQDAICGERVWQRDGQIRVEIGPLPRARFHDFLPAGRAAAALDRFLGQLTGSTLEVEVRLLLKPEEVPVLQLGNPLAGQLGWDTWLNSHPPAQPPADTAYSFIPGFLGETLSKEMTDA